jgi:hypothetical protein
MNFRNKLIFYSEELLAPCPTPKLEEHSLSAVCDCLFNIFAAKLHIWRPSPPSRTWGRAMLWWQGTHLTWVQWNTVTKTKKLWRWRHYDPTKHWYPTNRLHSVITQETTIQISSLLSKHQILQKLRILLFSLMWMMGFIHHKTLWAVLQHLKQQLITFWYEDRAQLQPPVPERSLVQLDRILNIVNICTGRFWDLVLRRKLVKCWRETSTKQKLVLNQTACTNLHTPWTALLHVHSAAGQKFTFSILTLLPNSYNIPPADLGDLKPPVPDDIR